MTMPEHVLGDLDSVTEVSSHIDDTTAHTGEKE